ncbi:MAG TPA: DUF5615 family PIN-like protein [Pirellulaceae bacterium]|nr:DUF5615 family PIN-like protein [Pirellulaceae bacterium]
MRIYLDEDIAAGQLLTEIRRAGHDVQVPGDAGLLGESDPVQFAHAIRDGGDVMTGNHHDFDELHSLILVAGGKHPGALVIRKDDDRRRDMTNRQIVQALTRLQATAPVHENQLFILNHWR